MGIISSNAYLDVADQKDNAQYIMNYFTALGWTKNAICGMLGNMQRESTMNPGLWEGLQEGNYSGGYGLVQWTPATNFTNWATKKGYNIGDIKAQCERIQYEYRSGLEWYPTASYPLTWGEYQKSTESPEYLAECFCYEYERPGVVALEERRQNARYWYNTLTGGYVYAPRLNDDGIVGSKYYYSENPFYQAGYGLPNCTCYAWGRRYEILDEKPTTSLGNADTWWDYNKVHNVYKYGSVPQLGAIICFRYAEPYTGQGGHVAIVEKISKDGKTITTSNSAYGGTFFYTQTLRKADNWTWWDAAIFQGFIYLPEDIFPVDPNPPPTPQPTGRKKSTFMQKYYLYNKYYRW